MKRVVSRIVLFLSCIIFSCAPASKVSAEDNKQKNMLELNFKELKDEDVFCYKKIPWGTQKNVVEDILEIELNSPANISKDGEPTDYILKDNKIF